MRRNVALSVAQFASLPLDRRGSVHSCSQYVTRPPFWHTKRTPPSWEISVTELAVAENVSALYESVEKVGERVFREVFLPRAQVAVR